MRARLICLAAVLVGLHGVAFAQIHKCKTADGGFVFQGTPCSDEADTLNKKPAAASPSANAGFKRKDDGPGANWDIDRPNTPVDRRFYEPLRTPAPSVAANPPSTGSGKTTQASAAARQINQSQSKANEEMMAFNKQQRCEYAKRQLDVLRMARPVYTLDNKAERHYIEDADRPAKITAAQREVTEACN